MKKEKQHITIHIADVPPLDLGIKPEKEEKIRKIEQEVNQLWSNWCVEFKNDKTTQQVLAMVAFRYAQVYYELLDKVNSQKESLENVESALDEILLGLG